MQAPMPPHGHTWRNRRWADADCSPTCCSPCHFFLDIQILEGALTASRFVGFHLIDLNSALQVMLAHKHIIVNLLIGTGTVMADLGCCWAGAPSAPGFALTTCWPNGRRKLHLWLAKKKLVTDQNMNRRLRTVFWVIFALATVGSTGYTVYEAISPTGILSRALIYGPGLALLWVAALLLFEIRSRAAPGAATPARSG
jgi:ferredoxin-type protein NapH